MTGKKLVRCAVYTRKSTEHNLDLEFNSLDAQREACEAYIKSQALEGWILLEDRYDDGGISGASLQRPDLQRLLHDIESGRVDTVVVYKVDRLTRSLTDFAKLVELFDAKNVSFVSVTQSFNTTSSMGRLTLNVLLSFAQFEREVIGERVRDKVAASKRKGLWMGGCPPLGYINQDKKLVVVPGEAETVRWIFQRYLALGSVVKLLEHLNTHGVTTKVQKRSDGQARGGVRFGKGALGYLLKNRTYIGEVCHRGEVFAGDHAPILERGVFEAVQAKLRENEVRKEAKLKTTPYLLTGLLFDSAGNAMGPTHTNKRGVRYRYYVSQAVLQARRGVAGAVFRVPAEEVESLVWRLLRDSPEGSQGLSVDREYVRAKVSRVTVQPQALEVTLRRLSDAGVEEGLLETVSLPWTKRPTVASKGIVSVSAEVRTDTRSKDAVLKAIGKARLWMDEILAGSSFHEIAAREGKCERHIRSLMPLAFVPPHELQALIEDKASFPKVTGLAKAVQLVWL